MFASRRVAVLGGDDFRDEYSLAFDGTNDHIRVSSTTYDTDGGNVSFVFWVKRAELGEIHIIMGLQSEEYQSRIYFSDDNKLRIEGDVNGDEAQITQNTNDTEWHHWVLSVSSSVVTAYQDGVSASVANAVDEGDFTIDQIAGGGSATSLTGSISEIAIYNTNLSSSQAKVIYNGREPYNHREGIALGNLTAWWRMGDGTESASGVTIYDMSSNSNNGTMTNMDATTDYTGDVP